MLLKDIHNKLDQIITNQRIIIDHITFERSEYRKAEKILNDTFATLELAEEKKAPLVEKKKRGRKIGSKKTKKATKVHCPICNAQFLSAGLNLHIIRKHTGRNWNNRGERL